MPIDASSLGETPKLKALFLGDPKVGKTTTLIQSAVQSLGSGYVICCSTPAHLRSAQLLVPTGWEFDIVKGTEDMEGALKAAREGVKSGKYNWVLLDDFNLYADRLEVAIFSKPGVFPPTAWHNLSQLLMGTIGRLLDLKTHVLMSLHYFQVAEGEDDDKPKKKGKGVIPLIPGQAKQKIPALLNQVIWMQKAKDGERVFVINPEGVYGVASQGLRFPKGTIEVPADLSVLIKALENTGEQKEEEKKT